MSRSYWLSLCAAVGLALAVPAHSQPVGHNSGANTSASQSQTTPTPKPKPSSPVAVHNVTKGTTGPLKATNASEQAAKKSKYDSDYLQTQKDMAAWAGRMFVVAAVETVITFFGVILVALTLRAARDSAREAGKAAKEAKRQADAAESALAQTRLATESELRAWVDVDVKLKGFKNLPDHTSISLEVRVVNVGRTPALNVATSQNARPVSSSVTNGGGLPAIEKWPNAMPPLMPGKDAEQRFGLRISKSDSEKCIAECKGAVTGPTGLMVTVDVIAYYRTIFDKPDAELRMTSIRYNIHPAAWEPPHVDLSRDWIRTFEGTQVKFSHQKSAPVYMT